MNKFIMFKRSFYLVAAILVACMFLFGCDKTGEPGSGESNGSVTLTPEKIAATVAAIGDKVDEVRLVVSEETTVTLAKAEFKNNSFSLPFPDNEPSAHLIPISEEWVVEEEKVSDASARILFAKLAGYKAGIEAGSFEFGKDEPATELEFIYADRDVSITGTVMLDYYYIRENDVHLKKGWNIIAVTDGGENSNGATMLTTTIPEGITCTFDAIDAPDGGAIETITVQVENGNAYNSQIGEVKTVIAYDGDADPHFQGDGVVASSSYINGGFTINLPELESMYLLPATEEFPSEMGFRIGGNADASLSSAILVAYDKYNHYSAGYIWLQYEDGEQGNAMLYYCDSDMTVTGRYTGEYSEGVEGVMDLSLDFKKGWNWMYMYVVSQSESRIEYAATTEDPGGMKWYFQPYGNGNAKSAAGAKLPWLWSK
ncbi:MAG: hypothetical protein LBV41_00030 [Cytophagaceae bacterium]|jgi:predicted small secreted protein|nr:hypothetical protein [Cytophagaceae bacterium]